MSPDDKIFEEPVRLRTGSGITEVSSVVAARDILSAPEWPERGYRHEDAVQACLKVLDGHRSTVDARDALVAAAAEAGILAEEEDR